MPLLSAVEGPPGTSKWNKIEHRMVCHVTENWRGRPLASRALIVNLIGHAGTAEGLKIHAALDQHSYPEGIRVSKAQADSIRLTPDECHGEWNYRIDPRND